MSKDSDLAPLPDRDLKRLKRFVWIVLILGVLSVFAGLDRFYKQHNPDPTNAHMRSTDERNVTVHDVGFRIPKPYFHPQSVQPNNSNTTTMLLSVELPDIVPQKLDSAAYFKMDGPHKLTTVLIESPFNPDGTPRLPLNQRVRRFAEVYKNTAQKEDQFGLHFLTRPADIRSDRDEIFYEGKADDPQTFLMCGPVDSPSPAPFPGCQMQFPYNGLIVQVRFRRADWLPQWRGIKQNTITRLDEFHTAYQDNTSSKQQ
jgi:hypothetical protein